MKRLIIIALAAALVIVVLGIQNLHLRKIRSEGDRLERAAESVTNETVEGSLVKASITAGVSGEIIDRVHQTFVEAITAFRTRSGGRDPEKAERAKQMMLAAKDFSAENIGALVERLRQDPRLAEMEDSELVEDILELIQRVNPKAVLAYLETHRDFPNWQGWFDRAYRECITADPGAEIERFDKESAAGNPDFATTAARQSVMLALVAYDPDRMLAMVMSPELAADPDALAHLGGFVDDRLETAAEHQGFMAALRRAEEKHPESKLLTTLRNDYVGEMSNVLPMWPFEQMASLVDGEFTTEERFSIAEKASHRGDLDDDAKWADWFLKIDPKDWDAWIADQSQQFSHPVIGLLGNWGREDPVRAAKWLENMPPSDLRSATVFEYAWTIADLDPEKAKSYLAELPDSKGKRNLEKKIEEAGAK